LRDRRAYIGSTLDEHAARGRQIDAPALAVHEASVELGFEPLQDLRHSGLREPGFLRDPK
jgi:hypothetical protein